VETKLSTRRRERRSIFRDQPSLHRVLESAADLRAWAVFAQARSSSSRPRCTPGRVRRRPSLRRASCVSALGGARPWWSAWSAALRSLIALRSASPMRRDAGRDANARSPRPLRPNPAGEVEGGTEPTSRSANQACAD